MNQFKLKGLGLGDGILEFSNSANYNKGASWNNIIGNVTSVGTNGINSFYGTFDQSGNVWEWTDSKILNYNIIGGGSWKNINVLALSSNKIYKSVPRAKGNVLGFRIATLNNPLNLLNITNDILNLDNPISSTGLGVVSYVYRISKYLITNKQYVEFLNSIAVIDDIYNLYVEKMETDPRCGVIRLGNNLYATKSNMEDKPVNHVSWFSCARYCNWLHNNKPVGLQNNTTTEDGAYILNGLTEGESVSKKNNAKYWIPSINEWYKAAYYSTENNETYYNYATQNNSEPSPVSAKNAPSYSINFRNNQAYLLRY